MLITRLFFQGIVTVSGCIDREEKSSYELTIVATDNAEDASQRKTSSMTLTINILDVNDNSPIFTEPSYNLTVEEDAHIGTVVATITATDADEPGTCNSNVSYNFTSPLFTIDQTTGRISTKEELIERVGTYVVIVVASDCGEGPRETEMNITINIQDVNLNPPEIDNFGDIQVYEVFHYFYNTFTHL